MAIANGDTSPITPMGSLEVPNPMGETSSPFRAQVTAAVMEGDPMFTEMSLDRGLKKEMNRRRERSDVLGKEAHIFNCGPHK